VSHHRKWQAQHDYALAQKLEHCHLSLNIDPSGSWHNTTRQLARCRLPGNQSLWNGAGVAPSGSGHWRLTQKTAAATTKTIIKKMAHASTLLSLLRTLTGVLIASPFFGFMGECLKTLIS
jgi:hypothetical protein